MEFILGSASPARLAILRSAGIEPSVVVSKVDEDALTAALPHASPEELVAALASAKAARVVELVGAEHNDAVIVGCDSLLFVNGEPFGKPGTPENARKQWAAMSGNTGELITGHAVIRIQNGRQTGEAVGTGTTTVRFADVTEMELERYIATGEPLVVAGSFTLDGLGGWFVDSIEGAPSNVIGISLPLLRSLLAELKLSPLNFWN